MIALLLGAAWASLTLDEVLAATEARLPQIAAAAFELDAAEADVLQARGAFDPRLQAKASGYTGPYDRTVARAGAAVQSTFGPEVSAGWQRGQGSFPEYAKREQTVEEGELYVALETPVLAGLGLGKDRAKLLEVQAKRGGVEASWNAVRRKARFEAAKAYWKWFAAGRGLVLANEQLALAERRASALAREIELGQRPEIDRLDNDRVLYERRALVAAAQAKLVASANELSLFVRDAAGAPRVPTPDELPDAWPELLPSQVRPGGDDFSWRPELAKVDAELDRIDVQRRAARNQLLPEAKLLSSVTVPLGAGDEVEWIGGLSLEVPLAFRAGRGRLASSDAELAAVSAERRAVQDAIRAELDTAFEVLRIASERADASRLASQRAFEVRGMEERRFELGGSDLFKLLQREDAWAKDRKALIEAEFDLRVAAAVLDAALWTADRSGGGG